MGKCILHSHGGGVAIIHATGELPVEIVARKDVPQGAPYLIIDAAAIPSDRTFRDAWVADFSAPDGYGDPEGYWVEVAQAQAAIAAAARAAAALVAARAAENATTEQAKEAEEGE